MRKVYNRKTNVIEEEKQYGGKYLNFLYNNACGRILLKLIINPVFSKINGIYNKSFLSKGKVKKFIEQYKIDLSEFEKEKYKSFNELFTRKKKKVLFEKEKNVFISPAESKLLVYKISEGLKINIKQSNYTINELLNNDFDAKKYKNGNCLVFRLSMDNYHRYCYIDNGKIEKVDKIKGKLHTVSSISNKHKVYSQNSRVCNYMKTENFGDLIYIEIGALLVGKITNYEKETFKKGEEKGYFELGGSTIVILTPNNLKIDKDILEYSKKDIETKVEYGERIGELLC